VTYSANHSPNDQSVVDIVKFLKKNPTPPDEVFFKELLDSGLSIRAIAMKIGRSKTYVVKHLKLLGMYQKGRRSIKQVPYGMCLKAGKLIEHPQQQKIIQLIINLENSGFNNEKIALALNAQGLRSKNGVKWQRWTVKNILDRENSKSHTSNIINKKIT